MHKYKGLLIDLDNCLYNYKECNDSGLHAAISKLSAYSNIEQDKLFSLFEVSRNEVKVYAGKTAASHSRLLYFQNLAEKININNLALVYSLHDLFWTTYISKIKLYDGVFELFDYLKTKDVKIAIVTDLTLDVQIRKLISTGLDKHIDFLVTSEEAGHDKPHPNIFRIALNKLNLDKYQVIMFGDDEEKDIKGARNFGIEAILVDDGSFKNESLKKLF